MAGVDAHAGDVSPWLNGLPRRRYPGSDFLAWTVQSKRLVLLDVVVDKRYERPYGLLTGAEIHVDVKRNMCRQSNDSHRKSTLTRFVITCFMGLPRTCRRTSSQTPVAYGLDFVVYDYAPTTSPRLLPLLSAPRKD